jgi:UDP:flavonoid glycosyltransferase YjiC (YdhE family)
MARILIATLGSLGDLHPFLAIGRELLQVGHEVTVASGDKHGPRIEEAGMRFAAIPPKFPADEDFKRLMQRFMDPRHGTDWVISEFIVPAAPETQRALEPLVEAADLVILHPFALSAAFFAERAGKPWVALPLAPMMFVTVEEPPVTYDLRNSGKLKWIGPYPLKLIMRAALWANARHWKVFKHLRIQAGLPPISGHPFFDYYLSKADLVIACFSRVLGRPLAEWPERTVQTGFAFFDLADALNEEADDGQLEAFLHAGEPPVIVTLGSTGVYTADDFYVQAWEGIRRLGRRAILLVGPVDDVKIPENPGADCLIRKYAPHAMVFPRGCVNVHHGGVNSTGQALRAGVPQLVVPIAHDQFDNAARIERAGCGLTLPKGEFTADRMTPMLERLLSEAAFAESARAAAAVVASEPGARGAAEAIDRLISSDMTNDRKGALSTTGITA